jgi:predicted CXXCH cytochrome family protein
MRAVVNIILAAMLGLGFGPAAYGAAVQKAPKPIEAIEPANCVTAECHANIKQYKVLHGPVNANTCDACHELVDAKEHKFQPTRQKAELCTFCHDFKVDKMPVVHEPVRRGECLGCHDPHGGNTDALTLGQTTPELCGRCHESVTKNKKFLHGPAASGDCNSCHRPHASRFPMMLDAEGPDLCLTCHTRLKEKLAAVRFPHKALEEGCDRCHDAHGSNHAMDLTQASSDLCLSCHDKVKDEIAKATYKHSVVTAERGCVMCHTPHGSDLAKMMSDYPL